jgi:biotin carboxylase
VLKANGTSGGEGVRVVHTPEEAERAFRALQAPPLFPRAVKRALVAHDKTLLLPSLLRRRSVVNAQEFVAGREATSAVACWKGSILASLHFEVIHKRDSAGPSSVLRMIQNAEMAAAAEAMVRRLNLSGLHGFDFMVESGTEKAHLIEINPRATQVGHLRLGPGRDLPAALFAALSGQPVQSAPRATENDTIALFPQEWMRDPGSAYLRTAYHDVPWEEPELLRACVRIRRPKSAVNPQTSRVQTLAAVRLPRL